MKLTGAIDVARLIGPETRGPPELTWSLSDEERSRVEIHWPRRYEWTYAPLWAEPVRRGMERLVRVVEKDIPQVHKGVVAIRMKLDGSVHDVIVDYSDYLTYDASLLDEVPAYFKMQCPIGADPRIIPGGYTPGSERIYRYLRRLRSIRSRQRFRFEVYGRFGLARARDIRSQAIQMLKSQSRFRYEGGSRKVTYPSHLREVASARVCVDLPGNGPLCFRQIDCLAIGSCVIGPKPAVVLPVPLIDRQEIVYTKDDLSDLVDLCKHYLEDIEARERIARNAQAYFDRYLHRDQLGAYYIRAVLCRLDGAARRMQLPIDFTVHPLTIKRSLGVAREARSTEAEEEGPHNSVRPASSDSRGR